MKKAIKDTYLYQVYFQDNLIFQGNVTEVAKRFYTTTDNVYSAYKKKAKFMRKYSVNRIYNDFTTKPYLIMDKAIQHYGKDNQLNIAIEEMSELTKELIKNKRGEENTDHIIEEMADVYIMLEQLKIIYDIKEKELNNEINFKIDRLAGRIKSDLASQ